MVSKRLGRSEGGKRKFLSIVDETPECARAARYAAQRAAASGGGAVFLYVIAPGDFQHWLGVEQIMRAEAAEAAETRLARIADEMREAVGIEPELVVREGVAQEEIQALIEADREIAILVLGASDSAEGPGPLVSAVAGRSNPFPIPVTIVPAMLSDDDIESLA